MPADPSRGGAACANLLRLEERHCPGRYVAIEEMGPFSGSTSYYDGNRMLFAAHVRSDAPQYCNRTSPDRIYGTLPTCPTAEIVTNLCPR